MTPHDALIELHRGLQRQGPGDAAFSVEILATLPPLPAPPRVADLGCGACAGALLLAEPFAAPVTAVDLSRDFLDQLERRARERGVAHLVRTVHADFAALDWPAGALDLLWSEGAAYHLTFAGALRTCSARRPTRTATRSTCCARSDRRSRRAACRSPLSCESLDSARTMVWTARMTHRGSCHCGKVRFTVEGDLEQAIECNCSHCSRKGYLLWFVDRAAYTPLTADDELATYTFNRHAIQHRFCPTCGCAPVGLGEDPSGAKKAAINVRCLEDVDLASLKRVPVDGRSL